MKAKAEECIRTHPDQAALVSLGAGFLLAQLPLRFLAAALLRTLVMLLKPAVLIYGIFRLTEDYYGRQQPAGGVPEPEEPEATPGI